METNREVLVSFERWIVVTIWKVILETMTLLIVILLLYHMLFSG